MTKCSACAWRICATCNHADERGEIALVPATETKHEMDVDENGRLVTEGAINAEDGKTELINLMTET